MWTNVGAWPRRIVRALVLAASLVCAAPAGAGNAPPTLAARPNIVFFLADDLGYGDLGCYGSPIIKTPRIDGLAAEGMRLTACYSAAPVCSPSRAGLLTGLNPNRLGIRDWIPRDSGVHLKAGVPTIASVLRAAGYRSGHVGKWHLNSRFNGAEPTPGDHGYDHWLATQNNAAPSHKDPANFVRNGRRVGRMKGNSTTLIVDEAIAFLKDTPADKPFLLSVWFHAPHEPVATPAEVENRYSDEPDATKRTYYGSVTLIDHEVGRLLDELERRGLRDNTIVVFSSDNGPEGLARYKGAERSHGSPGPLRGMKLSMYEGGYRVPGIVRWPGVTKAGRTTDEPVGFVDFLPTFAAAAGADVPAGTPLDGTDVRAAFAGGRTERAVPLFWQYDRAAGGPWRCALRDKDWKILANDALTQFALYNLKDDPAERHDLAAERPEDVARLQAAIRAAHKDVNGAASQ